MKFLYFYPFIWLLKKSRNLSALSCRLTQLTGKSKYQIHPKHLIKKRQTWYLRYIKKTDLVLDLGCGNGQHALRTARKCRKIIGLDNNKKQLKIGRYSAKDKKINNAVFLRHNLERKLIFRNNFFDKILCLDILEHIRKRKQFLLEMRRVLKPKGLIFITVPNRETSWKKIQEKTSINYYTDPDHKIEYSISEIKRVLSQAGFEILKIAPIVYDTPLVGFIDLIGGFSLSLYRKLGEWKKNKVKNNLKESIGFRIRAKKASF